MSLGDFPPSASSDHVLTNCRHVGCVKVKVNSSLAPGIGILLCDNNITFSARDIWDPENTLLNRGSRVFLDPCLYCGGVTFREKRVPSESTSVLLSCVGGKIDGLL